MTTCPLKICEERLIGGVLEVGAGSVMTGLPWFRNSGEHEWPNGVRIVLYLVGLCWLFMGVNIAADVFMGAIEQITSTKKRVFNKSTQKWVTVKVWNDTVANLSLMALGSSAPEILLSIIELLTASPFYTSGALGPSTIVGSAAFNLFCISAVCVVAIPEGEVRYINETTVFAVTATFSIFAYVWLLVIVQYSSPNYISIWEGIVSSLLFPFLVVLAYGADRGYFSLPGSSSEDDAPDKVSWQELSMEELAELEMRTRQVHGQNLTDEQLAMIIERENAARRTRAQYRVQAGRALQGGKKDNRTEQHLKMSAVVPMPDSMTEATGKDEEEQELGPSIAFRCHKYAVLESIGTLVIDVKLDREAPYKLQVDYKTRDGTAKAGSDFKPLSGTLEFEAGEDQKTIEVHIIDDTAYEEDEEFFVDLSNPRAPDDKIQPSLGEPSTVEINIVDDDQPGILSFDVAKNEDHISTEEESERHTLIVPVKRSCGSTGIVTINYMTEQHSAVKGRDYEHVEGTLTFENGQMAAEIPIVIIPRGRYEAREEFRLILSNPTGGAKIDPKRDGGKDQQNILTIFIEPDVKLQKRVDKVLTLLKYDHDRAQVGFSNYADQFRNAIYVNGGEEDGEDGEKPSIFDWVMHIITVFWKVLFAFVPPADFCGGWLCFFCSLVGIGLLTAFISDMATMVGCVISLPDSITAVTLVALGTSLPDTFASKTAAEQDPYADASIGNITGSNSVNVFLGLGLPWMVGAFYWAGVGRTDEWKAHYARAPFFNDLNQGSGKFVVAGGDDLGFCVLVFSVLALMAIALLEARRKVFGGELGGPTMSRWLTAFALVTMWIVFIIMYIVQVMVINPSDC